MGSRKDKIVSKGMAKIILHSLLEKKERLIGIRKSLLSFLVARNTMYDYNTSSHIRFFFPIIVEQQILDSNAMNNLLKRSPFVAWRIFFSSISHIRAIAIYAR